ncbi:hypothetical protein [Endozoicomonas ascidiicola]|uniref:hypothetical protein n=1 Tax=Endozoicomonas ascidiicola TaxID=1698521 RepID=UPI000832721A|nr:hypothetical protein [Endozoicomonas ascidiicola]
MGFFSKIFGKNEGLGDDIRLNDNPPIYGGDGLSENSPAIVNCASMGMAQAIINTFISDNFGEGSKRGNEYTINHPSDSKKSLKMIVVNKADGENIKVYFDLSRPIGVATKML